jgi:3-deoxy-D-manno-octulosonic-acid transferase
VALLDSLGELAAIYRLAAGAFVGGTLVPRGGHNPLEPARLSIPIAVGPSMENFRAIAEEFDRAGAWLRVRNADELGGALRSWLDEPESARALGARAAKLVEENQGALARTLEALRPLLTEIGAAP